jgi:hypothetical protein
MNNLTHVGRIIVDAVAKEDHVWDWSELFPGKFQQLPLSPSDVVNADSLFQLNGPLKSFTHSSILDLFE